MATYQNIVIPNLSDADLIDREITISDPTGLPNVTAGAPPTEGALTYIGRYEADEKIKCAFGHRHKKGYVFEAEDGRHFLIGHICGARDFGMGAWQNFIDTRESMESRIYYLRAVRDLDAAFRSSRAWLSGLAADPTTAWLDGTQDALARHSRLFNAVRDLVLRGNLTLFVHGNERDFAAEEREREAAVDRGEPLAHVPTIMRRVAKPIGTLRGGSLFTKRRLFAREIATHASAIAFFLDRGPDDLSTDDLRSLTDAGQALLRFVADLKEAARDAVAFFDPENLRNFAAWVSARNLTEARFVAQGSTLEGLDRWDRVVLRLQAPTTMYDFTEFDRLTDRASTWSERIEAAKERRSDRVARRRS